MTRRSLTIQAGYAELTGILSRPERAGGLVLVADGEESEQSQARHRFVARELNDAGLATLLLGMLTPAEARFDRTTGEFRSDLRRLTDRLLQTIREIREMAELRDLGRGGRRAERGDGGASDGVLGAGCGEGTGPVGQPSRALRRSPGGGASAHHAGR